MFSLIKNNIRTIIDGAMRSEMPDSVDQLIILSHACLRSTRGLITLRYIQNIAH